MPTYRHILNPALDERLVSYGSTTWDAHEAVYALQQMVGLLPAYRRNLQAIYGRYGVGDVRRLWGIVADLSSAIVRLPPTIDTLIDLGFHDVASLDYISEMTTPFALAASSAVSHHQLLNSPTGDVTTLLTQAVARDTAIRPVLKAFEQEIRVYDVDAQNDSYDGEYDVTSFADLALTAGDQPTEFPVWDGRPLFLDEQRGLLDYLGLTCGLQVLKDCVVDGRLGECFLRASGIVRTSAITGEAIFDLDLITNELLSLSVSQVCHRTGSVILQALNAIGSDADWLDRLFIAEVAVNENLHIDISKAFDISREMIMERHMRSMSEVIIDVTDTHAAANLRAEAQPYDFPELS